MDNFAIYKAIETYLETSRNRISAHHIAGRMTDYINDYEIIKKAFASLYDAAVTKCSRLRIEAETPLLVIVSTFQRETELIHLKNKGSAIIFDYAQCCVNANFYSCVDAYLSIVDGSVSIDPEEAKELRMTMNEYKKALLNHAEKYTLCPYISSCITLELFCHGQYSDCILSIKHPYYQEFITFSSPEYSANTDCLSYIIWAMALSHELVHCIYDFRDISNMKKSMYRMKKLVDDLYSESMVIMVEETVENIKAIAPGKRLKKKLLSKMKSYIYAYLECWKTTKLDDSNDNTVELICDHEAMHTLTEETGDYNLENCYVKILVCQEAQRLIGEFISNALNDSSIITVNSNVITRIKYSSIFTLCDADTGFKIYLNQRMKDSVLEVGCWFKSIIMTTVYLLFSYLENGFFSRTSYSDYKLKYGDTLEFTLGASKEKVSCTNQLNMIDNYRYIFQSFIEQSTTEEFLDEIRRETNDYHKDSQRRRRHVRFTIRPLRT